MGSSDAVVRKPEMKKESGGTEKFIDYEYYHPKVGASEM